MVLAAAWDNEASGPVTLPALCTVPGGLIPGAEGAKSISTIVREINYQLAKKCDEYDRFPQAVVHFALSKTPSNRGPIFSPKSGSQRAASLHRVLGNLGEILAD